MSDESTRQVGGFGMPAPGQAGSPGEPAADGGLQNGEAETLPPEATIDLSQVQRDAAADEILRRIEEDLVGLEPVKTRIREIASLLIIDGCRRRFGLSSSAPTLHMSFTGSPGTGKTTVALRMAELLHGLGYLRKGHLTTAGREDLVGEYIGHTAPKTKQVLAKALGGVLFIDEAYSLHRAENERDYGQEAIEILLQAMEDQRDDLVVIFAGYREPMRQFFGMNPGLASRVAHHIDFPDYTTDELISIAHTMLDEENYTWTEEAEETFRRYLERRREQPHFANARSVRNALERARLRHANRLVREGGEVGREDLRTLTGNEFLQSRVFTRSADDAGGADAGTEASAERDEELEPSGAES